MNEKEEQAFKIAYEFYRKWREIVIETEEQWINWANDLTASFRPVYDCPLGHRLMESIFDTFSDLYRNGMKPLPADYFGRDDL
jgi:hypothetical protein